MELNIENIITETKDKLTNLEKTLGFVHSETINTRKKLKNIEFFYIYYLRQKNHNNNEYIFYYYEAFLQLKLIEDEKDMVHKNTIAARKELSTFKNAYDSLNCNYPIEIREMYINQANQLILKRKFELL
jgi:hypothetical protein